MFLVSALASACRVPSEDTLILCSEFLEATHDCFQLLGFFLGEFGHILHKATRQSIMAEEQSCLTRVNLYISLEIFWKYRMLSTIRRGSSTSSLVMMFLYPLPDTSRSLGFLEVPAASSVDGCGAPAS
jgi:hypothetical protein